MQVINYPYTSLLLTPYSLLLTPYSLLLTPYSSLVTFTRRSFSEGGRHPSLVPHYPAQFSRSRLR
jgi:hypothetical protein